MTKNIAVSHYWPLYGGKFVRLKNVAVVA